jgi:hypothetical protein
VQRVLTASLSQGLFKYPHLIKNIYQPDRKNQYEITINFFSSLASASGTHQGGKKTYSIFGTRVFYDSIRANEKQKLVHYQNPNPYLGEEEEEEEEEEKKNPL